MWGETMHSIYIDSGIYPQYVLEYVDKEICLPRDGSGRYIYKNCYVTITPTEGRTFGSVRMPRTDIHMWGAEADCKEFERLYQMRFLSAGG